jgi:site-specific recombinase XerD
MARKTEQHRYYTEEKWERVNPFNKKLCTDFLRYCRSTDKSPETLGSYESNLRIFFIWFLDNADNKNFTDVEKIDIMNFQDWMISDQHLSSNRVRQLKSTISSLSNYICDMLDRQYPDFRNIVNKIKPPAKVEVREKTIFTNEQIDLLLKTLVERKKYMYACMVACLAASGVRKGEIIQFKVSFFDEKRYDEDAGYYITPEIRCKGAGKLGKKLTKFVIREIMYPYFELWMKQREELGIDCDEMFVIRRNGEWKPIGISTVNSAMNTFSQILNLNAYSHAFRHYAATWLKRNGVETSKIRDFLGHNDSSTTEIYIDIGKEENLKDMLSFMKNK